MRQLTINRLELTNFKLIKGSQSVNLNNNKLIVLDGPNGYGKTTIFDAIEILCKGYVDKVYNTEYNDRDKPVVYANDTSKPVIIKGEFIDQYQEKFIIMRIIEDPSTGGTLRNKTIFKTFRLEEFEDSTGDEVTQEYINELLGFSLNEEIYNLLHYIQQEDTLFFLKKNEGERRNEINKLFNMEKESNEREKLIKLRDKLNSKKREIGGEDGTGGKIKELEDKIRILDKLFLGKEKDEEQITDIQYLRKITWKSIPWDEEILIINEENYKKINAEIEKIKLLISYKEDFLNYKYNEILNFCLMPEQEKVLKGSILLLNFIEDYEKLNKQFRSKDVLEKTIKLLLEETKFTVLLDYISKNSEEYYFIKHEFDMEDLRSKLEEIVDLENESSELSKLITNISDLRNKLKNSFVEFTKEDSTQNEMCPLCGFDYNETDLNLYTEIQDREAYFLSRLDKKSEHIVMLKKLINDVYIKPLINILNKKVSEIKLEREFIDQLDNYFSIKDRILKFKELCKDYDIDVVKFINQEPNYNEEDLNLLVNKLKKAISEKKKPIFNMLAIEAHIDALNNVFNTIFDKKQEHMQKLTIEDLIEKQQYIDRHYFKSNNSTKMKLTKEVDRQKIKYNKLNQEYNSCKKICDIYTKQLRKYSTLIINQLQIPFYIYSGKILQDYQGGLGIFIKTEDREQQIRLKFVNENSCQHDVLNRFSSGQLSGLIISLVLSLNTVFSDRKFNTILIDDPLQSMDDINMASFVELLRNEFHNNQLILSTHDQDTSRFIRYKFDRFNVKSKRYNVKENLNIL